MESRAKGLATTSGRGTDKEIVIGIRQRGGELRSFHAEDVKSDTLAKYIKENIAHDVDVIMTDDFGGYPSAIAKAGVLCEHKTIKHKDGIYAIGDVYTNTAESAFSLLKRGIVGTWHRVSAKHLQAYLDEMSFRFDNRNNPYLFRDTLRKMPGSRACRVQETHRRLAFLKSIVIGKAPCSSFSEIVAKCFPLTVISAL